MKKRATEIIHAVLELQKQDLSQYAQEEATRAITRAHCAKEQYALAKDSLDKAEAALRFAVGNQMAESGS